MELVDQLARLFSDRPGFKVTEHGVRWDDECVTRIHVVDPEPKLISIFHLTTLTIEDPTDKRIYNAIRYVQDIGLMHRENATHLIHPLLISETVIAILDWDDADVLNIIDQSKAINLGTLACVASIDLNLPYDKGIVKQAVMSLQSRIPGLN